MEIIFIILGVKKGILPDDPRAQIIVRKMLDLITSNRRVSEFSVPGRSPQSHADRGWGVWAKRFLLFARRRVIVQVYGERLRLGRKEQGHKGEAGPSQVANEATFVRARGVRTGEGRTRAHGTPTWRCFAGRAGEHPATRGQRPHTPWGWGKHTPRPVCDRKEPAPRRVTVPAVWGADTVTARPAFPCSRQVTPPNTGVPKRRESSRGAAAAVSRLLGSCSAHTRGGFGLCRLSVCWDFVRLC